MNTCPMIPGPPKTASVLTAATVAVALTLIFSGDFRNRQFTCSLAEARPRQCRGSDLAVALTRRHRPGAQLVWINSGTRTPRSTASFAIA